MKVPVFFMKVIPLALLLFFQHFCKAAPPLELSPHFLLDSSTSQIQHIVFRQEDGQKNRELFEQKYGQRGEKLIAALGSGLPGVLDYHIQEQQRPLEHIKNEKSTTVTEALATTSIPEMNSTDAV